MNGVRSQTKLLTKKPKKMKNLINFDDVNTKIISIRNQNVILDSDVATLYGVQTMRINEAVKNNPKKFPEGYVFQLKVNEFDTFKTLSKGSELPDNQDAIENFDGILTTSNIAGDHLKSTTLPKAFTEKGLYMLATILKSDRAIAATIAIVETFAKLKELTNNLAILNSIDTEVIEPEVIESTIEKTSGLFNEIFFQGTPTSAETSVELNLGLAKVRRTIKSESPVHRSEMDELKKMIEKISKKLEIS